MALKFIKKLINKIKKPKQQQQLADLQANIQDEGLKRQQAIITPKANNQKAFDAGLKKAASTLAQAVDELTQKYHKIDPVLFEKIEELLFSYDVGVYAVDKIMPAIQKELLFQKVCQPALIKEIILDKLFTYYIQDSNTTTTLNLQPNQTNIILIMGVNGVGKTTTIAKLAYRFCKLKQKVLLVAGDTFRAGAIAQLSLWAQKVNCDIVVPKNPKIDAASVIYDGVKKGYQEKYDLVICDTSGRLHNKNHLMQELHKIYQVIQKFDPKAPHEALLILDATLGQTGLHQAKAFCETGKVSGLILTKMDGTSKGGIVLAIKDVFNLPVKFVGLGEKMGDLSSFDLEKFLIGLTNQLQI